MDKVFSRAAPNDQQELDLGLGSTGIVSNGTSKGHGPSTQSHGGWPTMAGSVSGGYQSSPQVNSGAPSNQTYGLSASQNVSVSCDPVMRSEDPNLPTIDFRSYDDAGNVIVMRLKPEGNISPFQALQLMMLIESSMHASTMFSAYQFVKKNNLAQHFKFNP